MKSRFILYRRKLGSMFYIEDTKTRKQESLGTRDRAEATALLNARNEAARQPQLNLLIAKAYLAGTDSGVSTRTWQNAFDATIAHKRGSAADRYSVLVEVNQADKSDQTDKATFDLLFAAPLLIEAGDLTA